MKRIIFVCALMSLLSGCALNKNINSLSSGDKAELDQKWFAYRDCFFSEFSRIDDQVTRPETIANAVINSCAKQREDFAGKFQQLNFDPSFYLSYIEEMRTVIRNKLIDDMKNKRAAKSN